MLLVTVEISSCVSTASAQWFKNCISGWNPDSKWKLKKKTNNISIGSFQCHNKPAQNPDLVGCIVLGFFFHLLVLVAVSPCPNKSKYNKNGACVGAAQVNTPAGRLWCCQGLCPLLLHGNVLSPPVVLLLLKGKELFAEARTWMSFVTWMFCPLAVGLCGSLIVLHRGAASVCSQTQEQDVRIWEPLVAASIFRWEKSCAGSASCRMPYFRLIL